MNAGISVERLRELQREMETACTWEAQRDFQAAALEALPALLHQLADAEAQLEDARWQLAYCFQQAGADTDGHFGPHLAPRALQAVTELRRDYDEACSAEHPAPFSVRHFKRKAEAAERAREEARKELDSAMHEIAGLSPNGYADSYVDRIAAFLAASGGA